MVNKTAKALKEGKDEDYSKMASGYNEVTPEDFGKMETNTKYYPHLSLKLSDIPEAEKWEIGKQYTVGIVVEMTGLSKGEDRSSVDFEILAVKAGEETGGFKDEDDSEGDDSEDDE